jgi:5-methylcytosine-specific restriction endonuclease McrA
MPLKPSRHQPPGMLPRIESERRRKALAEKRRPSAQQRGYTQAWARAAKAFLALPENRLCACGCGRIAQVVDRRAAHKSDLHLFWDRSNWQPMSLPCNSAKASRDEGGFGKPDSDRGKATMIRGGDLQHLRAGGDYRAGAVARAAANL